MEIDPVIQKEREVFAEGGLELLSQYWAEYLEKTRLHAGIAIPSFRGDVSIFALQGIMEATMPPSIFMTSIGSLVYAAREEIVRQGLKSNYPWDCLVWVDNDVRIPFFGIMRMLQRLEKCPMQTGLVCFRRTPITWSIYDMNLDEKGMRKILKIHQEHQPCTILKPEYKDQVIPVRAGGMAFAMVARKVYETLKPPYFQPWDAKRQEVVGEDIFFWEKALEAGFQLYADTSIMCEHFEGTISYPGILFKTGRFRCPV